jgi:hypothetical protein
MLNSCHAKSCRDIWIVVCVLYGVVKLLGTASTNKNVLETFLLLRNSLVSAVDKVVHVHSSKQGYLNIVQALYVDPAWFNFYTFDYISYSKRT